MCGLNCRIQAWTPFCRSPAFEAATHSLLILLGGSLKAEGFGDGFSLVKHIHIGRSKPAPVRFLPLFFAVKPKNGFVD
jgi:hypothetical protein